RYLRDFTPDVGGFRSFNSRTFNGNQNLLYAYVQDAFRFWNMDIELGLGYQYAQLPASFRHQSHLASLSVPGLIVFNKPDMDNSNFAPHVGIAWAASQTVVRGSFGINYDAYNNIFGDHLSPELQINSAQPSALDAQGF